MDASVNGTLDSVEVKQSRKCDERGGIDGGMTARYLADKPIKTNI